jgi:RNA polymerase sigma-70 factor (ECF subfamily)
VPRDHLDLKGCIIRNADKRAAVIAEVPHLRRFALSLLRHSDLADDLVQDCVSRALAKLDLFREGTNMRAWLFAILHNLYVQQLRDRRREAGDHTAPTEDDIRHAAAPDQESGLTVRDLSRALDALEDEHRQVILMIGVGELSYKQAAEVLGVPIGTVMSRLARGRARLRSVMAEQAKPTLRRVK